MSENGKTGGRRDTETVDWPEALLNEPEYPALELRQIDLACDAIVFKAPFDPDTF